MSLLKSIANWWARWRRRRAFSGAVFVSSRSDLPSRLQPDRIYIVGDLPHAKWASFMCPCRKGHRLDVNLMYTQTPRWTLLVGNDSKVTLKPSVWVQDHTCASHFWIVGNGVRWTD